MRRWGRGVRAGGPGFALGEVGLGRCGIPANEEEVLLRRRASLPNQPQPTPDLKVALAPWFFFPAGGMFRPA